MTLFFKESFKTPVNLTSFLEQEVSLESCNRLWYFKENMAIEAKIIIENEIKLEVD